MKLIQVCTLLYIGILFGMFYGICLGFDFLFRWPISEYSNAWRVIYSIICIVSLKYIIFDLLVQTILSLMINFYPVGAYSIIANIATAVIPFSVFTYYVYFEIDKYESTSDRNLWVGLFAISLLLAMATIKKIIMDGINLRVLVYTSDILKKIEENEYTFLLAKNLIEKDNYLTNYGRKYALSILDSKYNLLSKEEMLNDLSNTPLSLAKWIKKNREASK